MRTRKTYMDFLNEFANNGFVNYEEYIKIKFRIDSKLNGMGRK